MSTGENVHKWTRYYLLFFRRVRATSMTQRRDENTRSHFWTFSPVSVKASLVFDSAILSSHHENPTSFLKIQIPENSAPYSVTISFFPGFHFLVFQNSLILLITDVSCRKMTLFFHILTIYYFDIITGKLISSSSHLLKPSIYFVLQNK